MTLGCPLPLPGLMPEELAMQDGGRQDYSPVSAVIQVSSSVLIHICGMQIFSRALGYYIMLIKGGIASGSVHTYIFQCPVLK